MLSRISRLLVAGMVLLAIILASACGPSAPVPSTTKPTTAPTSAPAPTPSAAPVAAPKMGGILRAPSQGWPAGYDTHRTPSYGGVFGLMVFNHLVYYDPNKVDTIPQNIVPDLAERWTTSADGKAITFYLRKGVKWHDGVPFTADDVVYSIEKMTDPKRSNIAAAFPAYDGVAKVDDLTVTVKLKQASPSFLVELAGQFPTIQPKHKAEVDWRTTDFLVGTGPFKLKASTSGVSAEFVKNPDYFKKDSAGRQLPYLDGVIYTVIDVKSAIDAFVGKRFDQTYFNLGIPDEESLNRVKTQAPDAIVTERASSPGPFVFFNQKLDQFKDIRVRQAMALLVDQKELAVAGMGGVNWGVYNTFIFAPAWDLPGSEVQKGFGWDQPMDARVAQAKKLMADAGYASGFKTKLLFWTVPMMQKWTQVLSDVWKRHLNIDVTLDPRGIPDARAMIAKGEWEMCLETLVGQVVGDPDESIPFFTTGGRLNTYKYSNPKVDDYFARQSLEMDVAKRKQMTLDIGRTVMADMSLVPMLGATMRMGQYPYVKGYKDQGYGSPMAYEYVWLDK